MPEVSILNGTKKALNLAADYDEFDPEIIMHINSAFSTLNQLGLGPVNGFMIEDDTTLWDAFLAGNKTLNSVKQYVFVSVKLVFDPPTNSFMLEAMKNLKLELEWRLNVVREGNPVLAGEFVLDGGTP